MRSWPLLIALLAARAWAQPAALSGFSDEGAFLLYVNEERIGRFTFQWKVDGTFESKTVVSLGGQSVSGAMSLTPDAEGRWIKAVIESPSGGRVWEREGATISFTAPDKSGKGTWPEDVLTFETYSPPLISQALLRYNLTEGGRQTLPVLVLDANVFDNIELILERQETVERTLRGRSLHLTRWVYAPPGHEFHVLADPEGRVYLASGVTGFGAGVPERSAVFVREGYEDLRETPVENGPISEPKYEVKLEAGVKVPMRDGVQLSTDLYLPAGASEKAPVILIRTPYKKEMDELQGRFYARRGYVVGIQDVRGRFASAGQWEPFVNEAKDGYDTIEWLAAQAWSNGKVGMIGPSYLGWVQWWAASLHPPHLTAMIPNVSPPDPFHNMPFDHGILDLRGILSWADLVETNATGDLSGKIAATISRKNLPELLRALPAIELDKPVLGKETPYWRHWLAHPTPDPYWADTMFLDKLKDVRIPVFHQSGWFDGDSIGTKLNYLKMASHGHANQKLTIGPWEHTDTAVRLSVGKDFGSAAAIDLQRDYLRWFDCWLKGIDNGIAKEPLVSLFVMGSNRWLYGPSYPLPETHFEKLYLSSGGHANTSKGDGHLSFKPPDAKQAADRYVYDPGDPTPEPDFDNAARDRLAAARTDTLVYISEPFEKAYTIAGPVSAVLYASSSARDTDWFVHLVEVDQDGKSSILWSNGSGGQIRARYRNSLTKPQLIEKGKIYKYTIDLWQTGVMIAPGHRLRVEVASSAFPKAERNLNTGGSNETGTRFVSAHQAIYHDARRPSHILLPMIPEK
jgi:putative CocE/NonD family hydrolase